MRARTLFLGPAAALMTLAGCAHSRPVLTNPALLATPAPAPARQVAYHPAPARAGARNEGPGPVYFDFDSALLSPAAEQDLQKAAAKLRREPSKPVLVEGNCDERGTEAYNLALGEHRALAAKRYLARLGVDANRVKTVSYGKDRPKYLGHDQSSWAKNRRDDVALGR